MPPMTRLSVLLLAAIGLVHLLRLVAGVAVTIDGTDIPAWPSAVAAIVTLALAVGTWREHRPRA